MRLINQWPSTPQSNWNFRNVEFCGERKTGEPGETTLNLRNPNNTKEWIAYGSPNMFFGLQVVFVGTSFEFLHISNPHVFGSWNKGKFNKPLFRVQLNFNILNSILCVAFLSYLKNYNIKPRYQEEVTFLVKTGNVGQEKFVQNTTIYRVVTRIESCSMTLPCTASLFNALQTLQGL